jgi:hypothetical protein
MMIAKHAQKATMASAMVRTLKARKRAEDLLPVLDAIRSTVNTLHGIAETLNQRGIPAPRGGKWFPAQVSRVLALA